jgi:hypothetical protein
MDKKSMHLVVKQANSNVLTKLEQEGLLSVLSYLTCGNYACYEITYFEKVLDHFSKSGEAYLTTKQGAEMFRLGFVEGYTLANKNGALVTKK